MSFGNLVIVDWEAYCSPWTMYFTKLWNYPEFADAVIHCKNDIFNCHSIILAAHSEHFHSAFLNSLNVQIEEVQIRELKAILAFMYTGRVIIKRDQLGALLEAAKTLWVTKLIELIEKKSFTTLEEFLSAQDKDNDGNGNNCDQSQSSAASTCQQTTTPTAPAQLPQEPPSAPALIAKPLIDEVMASSSIPPLPSNPELAAALARLSEFGVVIHVARKTLTGDDVPATPENYIFQRPDASDMVGVGVGQPTPATSTLTVTEPVPEPNNSSEELQEQFSPLKEQELTDNSIPLVILDDTESESEETVEAVGCQTDMVSDNVKVIRHGVTVTDAAFASEVVSAAADDDARFSEYRRSIYSNEVRQKVLNDLRTRKGSLSEYARRSGIPLSTLRLWLTKDARTKEELGSQKRSKSEQFRRYKKAQELVDQGTSVSAAAMQVGVLRTSLIAYLQRTGVKKAKESDLGIGESNGRKGVTAAAATNGSGENESDGGGTSGQQNNWVCTVWS